MRMHIPVLLKEVMEYLNPKPGDVILDATINGGGHAREILKKIGEEGTLIGIEQDSAILEKLKSEMGELENVILINGNFRDLDELLVSAGRRTDLNKIKKLNGALFDLGMSSLQLDSPPDIPGRGFSFQKDEPLLMNFKREIGPSDLTAADILNKWSEEDIREILYEYGEERYGRRIAAAIVKSRENRPIVTTFELVEIIRLSVPPNYRNSRKINCCTKTFQALRIAVNDELGAIEEGIAKAWKLLAPDARLAVISFHSLEDRIVKFFFRELREAGEGNVLTKKPVIASEDEAKENPRSRSAKLRVCEKKRANE